jgi:O-antigen ligase
LLGFVIIITGFYQLLEYYRKVNTDLIYAYELKSPISINQTLYTISAIFAFIIAFSQKNKYKELFVIMMTSLYVVFLISTFSRTFWLMLGASIFLMFFFLPAGKKIMFITYLGIMSLVLFLAAFLFMRDKADIALGVAFSRFESTSAGRKDPSLIARFKEWEKLEYHIKQNPLGGNGLAKDFTFHFPINSRARHTTTIHNGYLWLAFRTGIPLSLLFLFFVTFYTIMSGKLIFSVKEPILRAIIIACFATLLSMYIFNMTSAQYFTRDGIIVTSFTIALIGVVSRINTQNKSAMELQNNG